jgi:hypothetical protein
MLIQLKTDNHIDGRDPVVRQVATDLEQSLARFAAEITRLEVHFHDANAHKAGDRDKRCLLEARLRGHDPLAVSHSAATLTVAYQGARDKLVKLLARHDEKHRDPGRRVAADRGERLG